MEIKSSAINSANAALAQSPLRPAEASKAPANQAALSTADSVVISDEAKKLLAAEAPEGKDLVGLDDIPPGWPPTTPPPVED